MAAITNEIGDLLLAVVNTARLAGVDSGERLLHVKNIFQRFEALESELAKRSHT